MRFYSKAFPSYNYLRPEFVTGDLHKFDLSSYLTKHALLGYCLDTIQNVLDGGFFSYPQ